MPALVESGCREQPRSLGPRHDMRGARPDLHVAAGAPVRLRGRGPRDTAHNPASVPLCGGGRV